MHPHPKMWLETFTDQCHFTRPNNNIYLIYGLNSPAGVVGVAVGPVYFGLVVSCDERHQVHGVCLRTDLQLQRASDEIRQLLAHLGARRRARRAYKTLHGSQIVCVQMCAVLRSRFMDRQGVEWCRNCVSISTDCQILHLPDCAPFVLRLLNCSAIFVRNAFFYLVVFCHWGVQKLFDEEIYKRKIKHFNHFCTICIKNVVQHQPFPWIKWGLMELVLV